VPLNRNRPTVYDTVMSRVYSAMAVMRVTIRRRR